MPIKSTPTHYGSVAITIHWISALLIIALLASGMRAGGIEDASSKAAFLRVHIPLGVSVLILTILRLIWWMFADSKPAPVAMPDWQDFIAKSIHVLFYVVILGMAISGIAMLAVSGAGPTIFSGTVEALPDFWDYKPRMPHGIGGRVMLALFVFHAGAALYHQFVKRDGLIGRMLPSRG
ncbi:cytochrome b [uncultured Erythrobacter sp.]|uniref:cytochrome b n=1 Tax=uncultured Erythrobacter sp. TaxID=263913 RepID=UPI0026297CE5|nr:cytochrome b [uncultured Erythrobacter sp.]